MSDFHPTRRRFTALLASFLSTVSTRLRAAGDKPRDNGIGGTGYISAIPDRDNGIGGTGVVGTIRGFGSIIVNGLRVSYPADAEVRIDGRAARVGDLRIGHVVSLVAERDGDKFTTKRIQVVREVVGPIEKISSSGLRVLGQTVEFGRGAKIAAGGALSVGQHVGVSGLRLPDQTIVASLVEPAAPGAAQLVGVVTRASDGRLAIGAQPLSGVAEAMLGQRIMVRGAAAEGGLDVTSTASDPSLPRGPSNFLVETYLERKGATVKTASGLELGGGNALGFKGVVRAILRIDATSSGSLSIRSFQQSESLGKRGAAKEQGRGAEPAKVPSRPAETDSSPGGGASFPSRPDGPSFGTPSAPGLPGAPDNLPGMPGAPGGFGGGRGPGGFGRPGR